MIEDHKSIVPSLIQNPLFQAFFFSDLTKALQHLDAKFAADSEEAVSEINSCADIISQQAHPFAKELLRVFDRSFESKSENKDDNTLLPANEIHELILFACLWLKLPHLFQAIFIRLDKFSSSIILQFYMVALRCQVYDAISTLHQRVQGGLIDFALSIGCPEEQIIRLWDLLGDDTNKRCALILLKANGRQNLPQSINEFYNQNEEKLFEGQFEIPDLKEHQISNHLLIPVGKPDVLKVKKLLEIKRFNQIYQCLNEQKNPKDSVYQAIADYSLADLKSTEVSQTILFLQLTQGISPLEMIKYFAKQNPHALSILRLMEHKPFYDLGAQYLAQLLTQHKPLETDFLRKVFGLSSPNADQKSLPIQQRHLLDSEIKTIHSLVQKMQFTSQEMTSLKLLFPVGSILKKTTSSELKFLLNDIWPIVGEYLQPSSSDQKEIEYYEKLLDTFPEFFSLSLNGAEKSTLRTNIARIDDFLIRILKLKQPPSLWQRFRTMEGCCWSGAIGLGLGIIGLFLVMYFLRRSVSQRRQAILASDDWQPCPSQKFNISDHTIVGFPFVWANCEPPMDAGGICAELCQSFNDIRDTPIVPEVFYAILSGILLSLLVAACYAAWTEKRKNLVIPPSRFNEIKGEITNFYIQNLNRISPADNKNISTVESELKKSRNDLIVHLQSVEDKDSKPSHSENAYLLNPKPKRTTHGGYELLSSHADEDMELKVINN